MARSKACFDSSVVCSDVFSELPATSQLLYFRVAFEADNYGIISNMRSVMRIVGAKEDDLSLLLAKGFLIPVLDCFAIRHWWKSNNRDSLKNMGRPSRPDVMELLTGGLDSESRAYEKSIQPEVSLVSAGSQPLKELKGTEMKRIEASRSEMCGVNNESGSITGLSDCFGQQVFGRSFEWKGKRYRSRLDMFEAIVGDRFPGQLTQIVGAIEAVCPDGCPRDDKAIARCGEAIYSLLIQDNVRSPAGLIRTALADRRGF